MNKKPKKLTNNIWLMEEENHYKNNGEQCCQICHAYMTEEEYHCEWCNKQMTEEDHHFCDICDDCRDEGENELAQV